MRILLLIVSLALPFNIYAKQATLYKIELMFFQYPMTSDNNLSETWPAHPRIPDLRNTLALVSGNDQDSASILPRKELSLETLHWAVEHKANARVLLHVAWLQNLSAGARKRIRLYSQNDQSPHQILPFNNRAMNELNGVLSIRNTNYFDISTDFIFNPKATLSGGILKSSSSSLPIALHQKRRLKLNELHYIDHPLLGVLIQITKPPSTSS